jgi:hypothetical protein
MRQIVVAMTLLVVAGCSSGSHGTASVTGTVLYRDKPVDGATVTLLPKSEDPKAKSATGKTNGSGQFTLTTYFAPDDQPAGAMPGEYTVIVTKIDEPQGAFDPHKDPPPKHHLPLKYEGAPTSPLTATIKPSSNRLEFKLED